MNENAQNQHPDAGQKHNKHLFNPRTYWNRIHHSWIFWVCLVLTLVALIYYIMSQDFSNVPQIQTGKPIENTRVP